MISKKRWYSSNIKGIRLWDGKIQIRKRIRSNRAFDIQENFIFLINRIILSKDVDHLHFASFLLVLSANDFEDISETGRRNLRSFLAVNSTQNYFLIARMLIFCDIRDKSAVFNILRQNVTEGGNKEKMRKCREWISLHFLILSTFPHSLHFLFVFSFSLHFLASWMQGCRKFCNPALKYPFLFPATVT